MLFAELTIEVSGGGSIGGDAGRRAGLILHLEDVYWAKEGRQPCPLPGHGPHRYSFRLYAPKHDHSEDGQEEVFFAVSGSGEIEIDGERYPLDPETMIRVGPGVSRKIWPGDEPMRVLAIGGVPGKPYEPSERSKLGVPDPMAQQPQA